MISSETQLLIDMIYEKTNYWHDISYGEDNHSDMINCIADIKQTINDFLEKLHNENINNG